MNDRVNDDTLDELKLEARMGGTGSLQAREVRRIDVSDFEARRAEITEQLWSAAVEVGFFQLVNHGIDVARVRQMFADSARFFALPQDVKARYPMAKGTNAGWEYRAQVRPSTGTPDQKESYQITRPRMAKLWPSEAELPGFQAAALDFEQRCWTLAMQVLSCFADKLGFARDFFTRAHAHDAPTTRAPCACCTTSRCPKARPCPRACGAAAPTPTSTA
jgi:isopenicillin N synthase-like dioxygenase